MGGQTRTRCGLLLLLLLSASTSRAGDAAASAVNVVLILADDQGWVDTSVPMVPQWADSQSDYYRTPRLEQLAAQGIRLGSAYAASPICSPSRASLQTGRSPQAIGITDIIGAQPGSRRYFDFYVGKPLVPPPPLRGLPANMPTIAELIKRAHPEYRTAHFGKWHLGGGGPQQHGYDESDGNTGNVNESAFSEDPDPKGMFELTARAQAFMRRQVSNGRPFFLQVSHYAVHEPQRATAAAQAGQRIRKPGIRHTSPIYAAMTENLDMAVGALLDEVDALGIADRTYVIYTSDNGGSLPFTSNLPLARGKSFVWEGGIRVPMLVRGPGIPPGTASDVPVIGWDMLPTVCAMIGCRQPLPAAVEGGSLLPLLQGRARTVERRRGHELVWHFPHYLSPRGTHPQSAIRERDLKLIRLYEGEAAQLYDVAADPGEQHDLAAQRPSDVRRLQRDLAAYLKHAGARDAVRAPAGAVTLKITSSPSRDGALDAAAPEAAANLIADTGWDHQQATTFQGIHFGIPEGWVLRNEDTGAFFAADLRELPWEQFEPRHDVYYSVGTFAPAGALENVAHADRRSLLSIARQYARTLHATERGALAATAAETTLKGRATVRIKLRSGRSRQYVVLIALADGRVATVAAVGARAQELEVQRVVDSVAASVEPTAERAGAKNAVARASE